MAHRSFGFTVLLLVAVGLVGCQPAQPERPATRLDQVQPLPILDQVHGSDQALDQPMVELVTTRPELEALGAAALADLNVDFNEQDVIVVALGQQPTGGYWVRLTGAQLVGDDLYVQGVANAPGDDQVVTQALTYPYAAAVIPKTGATMALSDIRSVTGQDPDSVTMQDVDAAMQQAADAVEPAPGQ